MDESDQSQQPRSGRRRASNACSRCRQHKIKCSGKQPCQTCLLRGLSCVFSDRRRYSQSYVRELQRRVAAAEQQQASTTIVSPVSYDENIDVHLPSSSETVELDAETQEAIHTSNETLRNSPQPTRSERTGSSGPIINHLAMGQPFYIPDTRGQAIYLGTSSNWSFGRRVLLVAQERVIGAPLTPDSLLWEGEAYNLGWNGDRSLESMSDADVVVPQADFGIYLINAVKFYVGQLFHLFDEDDFMDKFNKFYNKADSSPTTKSLWYTHYLFLLAFGKAFVAREQTKDNCPPGCSFFKQAMKIMPEFSFANADSLETMEVLCCASLYLHSLDFRTAAYKQIGIALRTGLERGLHTNMQHFNVPEHTVERSRRIWWTVLLLDRQMSALMGLPLAVRDQDNSAALPSFAGSTTKALALEIHVKLSSVMAMIVTNAYGMEGRQNGKFLIHTKTALKSIAKVTDELNACFELSLGTASTGISRVSAYLHLLHHQCIVLATRPILFNFLEARLAHADMPVRARKPSENIWPLLQMCKDSALQMLRTLFTLQAQGLLESFLAFDLDATSASTIVLQMAAYIDPQLIDDHRPWLHMAFGFLDEMASRGNRIAGILKSESQLLEDILARLPHRPPQGAHLDGAGARVQGTNDITHVPEPNPIATQTSPPPTAEGNMNWLNDSSLWAENLNAELMTVVADAINLDSMEWWFNRSPVQGS